MYNMMLKWQLWMICGGTWYYQEHTNAPDNRYNSFHFQLFLTHFRPVHCTVLHGPFVDPPPTHTHWRLIVYTLYPPPSPTECAPECKRCYGTVGKCTRCTACTSRLAEECRYESGHTLECPTQSPLDNTVSAFTINHEEYNYCGELERT